MKSIKPLDPWVQFWPKVDASGICWEWQGLLRPDGYGSLTVAKCTKVAHRYAYELLVGPIPKGKTLDHLCRNRKCVNPDHLEVVTRGENVLRGYGPTAMNARKTHCPKGHEYTPENTYSPKGTAWRQCRKCWKVYRPKRRKTFTPMSIYDITEYAKRHPDNGNT